MSRTVQSQPGGRQRSNVQGIPGALPESLVAPPALLPLPSPDVPYPLPPPKPGPLSEPPLLPPIGGAHGLRFVDLV